ncbi:TetR/AcrR family transcriptional regulator [Ramlibacter sp.]|jgi:AcrR family transcriptional regulator|uniref:TetR/AcrR family transcriptional regulator n=1 Tax=Ramlibacter sp. TaxID=1917967 RepID=UPI00261466BA|nr:TetR/AcrR family transcriptional regulator [Ramlibacter sp.]
MNELVKTRRQKAAAKTAGAAPTASRDPERTMAEILAVAAREFAAKGLAGARVDEIADATRTSKRMIYYYFGSKEGLYLQVLENAYRGTRQSESRFHLADLDPVTALKTLVGVTYDHHRDSEDFIRLVMNENMARGAFLRQSEVIQRLNTPAIEVIRDIYERGRALRVFREGLDPVEIHSVISALAFFNVSNRHTFGLIFGDKSADGKANTLSRELVQDLVMRYVWNNAAA